ncbi:tandem-95 repeat protein, partial [Vibrio cionasavignyae]|uniref:cadherin-like domain-containing protein n=1 Tax=Vibrio cionasavignyae TaxID=2910252 RepID=UPI003D106F7F
MVDNNENNPLNDAVEQVDTGDENVGQQQGQQNQQSTIATTIATGAESADAADEINEALNANPSAAGGNDQESEQSAPQGEGTESADAETQPESSNVIEGEAANAQGQGTEAPESNPVGAGAQSVGGDAQQSGSAGGQSAQGQTDPLSQSNSAAPSASTQAEPSTQTASEQFEVNVLDQQSIAQSQQDDSFDSETTQSTFEVQIDNVNDAAVVNGMEYTILEDGLLSFTAEDLLASASDIDGDSLSIAHVSYGGTDGVLTNLGGGTYTFAPNENFNGSIPLSYGVSDGTVVTDGAIDLTVESVNDLPVFGSVSYTVEEDNTLIFNEDQLMSNASDIEGDVSLVGVSYDGTDGIFTINNDGTCSFAPNENFNG